MTISFLRMNFPLNYFKSNSHNIVHQSILPWWCTGRLWGWRRGCYRNLWCRSWVLSSTLYILFHRDTVLREALHHMGNRQPFLLNKQTERIMYWCTVDRPKYIIITYMKGKLLQPNFPNWSNTHTLSLSLSLSLSLWGIAPANVADWGVKRAAAEHMLAAQLLIGNLITNTS